jgi:hypothetical protein
VGSKSAQIERAAWYVSASRPTLLFSFALSFLKGEFRA